MGGDVIAFSGWGFSSSMSVIFTDGRHRVAASPAGVQASDGGRRLVVSVPAFPPGCACGNGQPLRVNVEFDNGCARDDLNRTNRRFHYVIAGVLVDPAESVQAAIDEASEGTCVILKAYSTHLGPVSITGSKRLLTLTSEYPDSPGRTQLDGGFRPGNPVSDPTVTLDGCDDTVCVSGLNIILGNGGVEIKNGAKCIVSGCVIDDNIAENSARGGGITIRDNATPLIVGNLIAVNTASGGGGVRIDRAGGFVVGNTIQGNKIAVGGDGGGMYLDRTIPSLVIADNLIQHNQTAFACPILQQTNPPTPDWDGGGVYWTGGTEDHPVMGLLLRNKIFDNTNYDGQGIGLYIDTNLAPTISGNEIAQNRGLTERSRGGGVFIDEFNRNQFSFCNNLVHDNEAHSGGGGVILKKDTVHMYQNLVYCNRAIHRDCYLNEDRPSFAPGIYIEDASPTIIRNVIYKNDGGDHPPDHPPTQSGGLHCQDWSTGFPVFWDNIISDNDGWEVYSSLSLNSSPQ